MRIIFTFSILFSIFQILHNKHVLLFTRKRRLWAENNHLASSFKAHVPFFLNLLGKLQKINEISLSPEKSGKAPSINVIKELRKLNKSLAQMERSKEAGGGPVSLQVHVYTGGRFYFLCVCLFFFKCCGRGSPAALPTLAFVFLSVSHHLMPRQCLLPACVGRLCAFYPADFHVAMCTTFSPFLLCLRVKCVQKAHRRWFCRRRDGCPCRSSSAPGLVFRTVRLLTTLVGMTQSPRPLIFSKSKAHPLTRTPQLVNRRHASNS